MGKNREKEGVPGFSSIWRIETKFLKRTIVVMELLLIAAQFMPEDIPLCTNPSPIFLEEDSNPCGYSIQIRNMDQLNQMTKLNNIPNSRTTKPTTKAIEPENSYKRVFRPYGNAAYLFIQMGAYRGGGVHSQVRKVLEPWIRAGRVTLQDISEQEQHDGYYHNQFLVVNDCLHKYKFMANWTFFFDIDEYLYIPQGKSLQSVVNELSNYTQFTIEQYTMSNNICLQNKLHINESANNTYSRKWGIEKLVLRDVKRGIRRDRKYAVQARNVYATGVHLSQNLFGKTQRKTEGKIRYYHYHNAISNRGELCKKWVKPSMKNNTTLLGGTPYVYDGSMKVVAPLKEKEI